MSASRHRSTLIIYPRISCNQAKFLTAQNFSRSRFHVAHPPSLYPGISRAAERRETFAKSSPCFKEESSPRFKESHCSFPFFVQRKTAARIQRNPLAFRPLKTRGPGVSESRLSCGSLAYSFRATKFAIPEDRRARIAWSSATLSERPSFFKSYLLPGIAIASVA